MKKPIASLLLGAIVAVAGARAANAETTLDPSARGIGEPVPQFTAQVIDLSTNPPRTTPFDSRKTKKVTTYVFVGTTCPATNAYSERFKQIAQTYGAKGVDFIFIYPNSNDTADAKRAFHKDKQLGGRMIDDQGGKLAQEFRAQRTSELFVADKRGKIVYHGALDDSRDANSVKQRYLASALDELLAGKAITTPASQVFA